MATLDDGRHLPRRFATGRNVGARVAIVAEPVRDFPDDALRELDYPATSPLLHRFRGSREVKYGRKCLCNSKSM